MCPIKEKGVTAGQQKWSGGHQWWKQITNAATCGFCFGLQEPEHSVMENIILKTPLLIYFNFFPKVFPPKFELPNSGCSLSASAAYTPVFTVTQIKLASEK